MRLALQILEHCLTSRSARHDLLDTGTCERSFRLVDAWATPLTCGPTKGLCRLFGGMYLDGAKLLLLLALAATSWLVCMRGRTSRHARALLLIVHAVAAISVVRQIANEQTETRPVPPLPPLHVPLPSRGVHEAADLAAAVMEPSSCGKASTSVFSRIYGDGSWFNGKAERWDRPSYYYTDLLHRRSASGDGSDVGMASATSLALLAAVISTYGVRTLIDVPCGDVNWQFSSWETDGMLSAYIGLDIVPQVIALNQKRLAHHRNKRFALWDAAACELPRLRLQSRDGKNLVGGGGSGGVGSDGTTIAPDLIQVRDVLQHLPPLPALRMARHVVASGAPLVLATTYPQGEPPVRHERDGSLSWKAEHADRFGGMQPVNLAAWPFEFPSPVACTLTHPSVDADLTCLYTFNASTRGAWLARTAWAQPHERRHAHRAKKVSRKKKRVKGGQ